MAILYILCLSINVSKKKESYAHKIIPDTLRQAGAAAAARRAGAGPVPEPAGIFFFSLFISSIPHWLQY